MMTIIQLLCTSFMTIGTFRNIKIASVSHDNLLLLLLTDVSSFLIGIDVVCLLYFFIEYFVRFYAARHYKKFALNLLNINDLLCNVFSLISIFSWLLMDRKSILVDMMFYIFRVLRVFRLIRHIRRLEVLVVTFRCCIREIILFGLLCLIGIAISGTLIYLAELVEEQENNNMWNVFTALYFATTTWTTVGFGDIVPKSTLSMIFSFILCWVGTITILLPIPLMADNFSYFYRHFHHMVKRADLRGRLRMKRILERFVEGDPQVLYISTMSSTSSVSA